MYQTQVKYPEKSELGGSIVKIFIAEAISKTKPKSQHLLRVKQTAKGASVFNVNSNIRFILLFWMCITNTNYVKGNFYVNHSDTFMKTPVSFTCITF